MEDKKQLLNVFSLYIYIRGLFGNSISTIEENAFNGLSSLLRLGLSFNRITAIEGNAFNGLSSLSSLYLSNNSITTIQENAFNGLTSLSILYINGNPFHCDCELKGFVRFMKSRRDILYGSSHPECLSPGVLKGTRLADLSVSNLTCLSNDVSTIH
ncbi:slit homolog 3 protein-like [Saccostrea echinata]|uniref:slit homolog 3 protein-like n=1 Tax=Saccostrea echinata TaxID=191078 RepID=UPI002A80F4EA|nr:slit homolog 3 protein-like [Saccostrea echinata]